MLDKELALAIIRDMYEGNTLTAILKERGVSRYFFDKCKNQYPDIDEAYMRAKISITDLRGDELYEIADNEVDAQRARNRIDVRKFMMSKHNPKIYGDKLDLNIETKADINMAISMATERMKLLHPSYTELPDKTEDAEYIVENTQEERGSKPVEAPKISDADVFDPEDLFK